MTDYLITASGALQLCLGMSRKQEHKTTGSRASLNTCLLSGIHHGRKQETFRQMWRRSSQRFFGSVLYFHVVDCGAVFEDGID